MTLDLLELIYRDKHAHGYKTKDCIAAVVRELMEHFVTGTSTYAWDADDLHAEFMKILGDAGEKVAEAPDLPTRTVQLTGITKSARPDVQFEPATDPIRNAVAMARGRALAVDDIPTLNKLAAMMAPATAPAPAARSDATAVCEWTQGKDGWLVTAYRTQYRLSPFYYKPKGCCEFCGRNIKFTEVQREQDS